MSETVVFLAVLHEPRINFLLGVRLLRIQGCELLTAYFDVIVFDNWRELFDDALPGRARILYGQIVFRDFIQFRTKVDRYVQAETQLRLDRCLDVLD